MLTITGYYDGDQPGAMRYYRSFRFFSRRSAKGSWLRLVIRAPSSIYWKKNYNSGGLVAEETADDARTAHVTLYHDDRHVSFLQVPVSVPEGGDGDER